MSYTIIKFIIHTLSLIPRKALTLFAVLFGNIWFHVDTRHRRIAMDNMRNAFKSEFSETQCHQMVKKTFIQLSRVAFEIPSLLKLNKDNMKSYVEFSGATHLEKALFKGNGVIFLSAHFGNWELMTTATALKFNIPIHAIVRPLDYSPMDRILTEIRSRTGNIILDKNNSAGILRKLLSNNKVIGILLDQNASWYDGVYVPFFGRIACTSKGLALFAVRYNVDVIPVFNMRQKDGRYKIIFEPPISLIKTGNIKNDIIENTIIFNNIIEKYIRLAPDNWFWVHKRWNLKRISEEAAKKMLKVKDFKPIIEK